MSFFGYVDQHGFLIRWFNDSLWARKDEKYDKKSLALKRFLDVIGRYAIGGTYNMIMPRK